MSVALHLLPAEGEGGERRRCGPDTRVAATAGIEHSVTVRDVEAFKKEAVDAVSEEGLRFVVSKVEESRGHRRILRTNVDLLENKYQFVRYVERIEGKIIFTGRG